MAIQILEAGDVAAAWPLMHQLRPHIADETAFVDQVRRMMVTDGYRLAVAADADGAIVSAAGYRILEMLWCGRRLYVDDLITDEARRSEGHGAAMLAWLRDLARRQGCDQLALDTGTWRTDAHRFYEREGMEFVARHYVQAI